MSECDFILPQTVLFCKQSDEVHDEPPKKKQKPALHLLRDLPDVLFFAILQFLSSDDHIMAQTTNRHWLRLSRHPNSWCPNLSGDLTRIFQHGGRRLETVAAIFDPNTSFSGNASASFILQLALLFDNRRLKHLSIADSDLTLTNPVLLAIGRFTELTLLHLDGSIYHESCLRLFCSRLPNLTDLQLCLNCATLFDLYDAVWAPTIQHLQVTMVRRVAFHPSTVYLDKALPAKLPQLKTLVIDFGRQGISKETILFANHDDFFTKERFPSLTDLNLMFSDIVLAQWGFHLHSQLQRLSITSMQGNFLPNPLTPLDLYPSCPQLRELAFIGHRFEPCPILQCLPNLQTLVISGDLHTRTYDKFATELIKANKGLVVTGVH